MVSPGGAVVCCTGARQQQGFGVAAPGLAPLRDIRRRLDGIPLALEPAAAQSGRPWRPWCAGASVQGLQILTRAPHSG